MTITTKLLVATSIILLLVGASASQQTIQAEFQGELAFIGDNAPRIAVDGEVFWNTRLLRINVKQDLTMEELVLLVDYEKGLINVLYPDTLNGTRTSFEQLNASEHLENLRGFLDLTPGQAPPGWSVTEQETDDESKHFEYQSATGHKVDYWLTPDQAPARFVVTTKQWVLDLEVNSFQRGIDLSAAAFSIPEDYAIADYDGDTPAELPSL